MLWKMIMITIMLIKFTTSTITTIQSISEGICSGIVQLHSGSTLAQDSSYNFTTTMNSSFLVLPQVIISITEYQAGDPMRNQLMHLSVHTITTNSFTVLLEQVHYTKLSLLGISYLALNTPYTAVVPYDTDTFVLFWFYVQVNVSSGSGERYEVLDVEIGTGLEGTVELYDSLLGFYLRSDPTFSLSTSSVLTNSTHIELTVTVGTDSRIQRIGIMYLLLLSDQFPQYPFQQLYSEMGTYSLTTNLSIPYSSSLNWIIGLTSFGHSDSGVRLGFTVEYADGTFSFTYDQQLDELSFKYLLVGKLVCPAVYTLDQVCAEECFPTQTSSPTSRFCQICSDSCLTCSFTPATCSSCQDGYYLQNGECLQYDDDNGWSQWNK